VITETVLSYLYLMHLILITPDTKVNNEPQIINSLFANGLQRLHVRKPGFSYEQYKEYINNIDVLYHQHLVVCGSFELYSEMGLGGVHLNSHMRDDAAVWAQVAHVPMIHISTSFDSISKAGYKAAIDVQQCVAVRQEVISISGYCPQIIGLGGVGAQQVPVLRECGFDGAAALGSVWGAEDAVEAFINLINT
jgi:thiamine-phosphate pyrophosphorylase